MKKYILMRILRSLLSVFLVTTLTCAIVYSLVPRHLIFRQDPNYNKKTTTPDKKADYENSVYERMGYIEYADSKELLEGASRLDKSVTNKPIAANEKIYQAYVKSLGSGWKLQRFPTSKGFYATREIPLHERVWNFYANLIVIDHPWKIQDETNPDLERYVRLENDPAIGWSVVGSGTQHKYLLYVNGKFPYIHQNFITLNLGRSYPTYANLPVQQVITQGQGKALSQEVTFPTGATRRSPIDIYSRTYKSPDQADSRDIRNFGKGDAYTATRNNYEDPSMLANSFTIGLIGVTLSYVVGLTIGMLMAYYKNGWFDRFSTGTMTLILALPSVATIYIVRFVGSSFLGLPASFPSLGAQDWRSYVLPAVILGILGIPSIVIWFRRYMVDQQNSDYVRFARAKGLSETEISKAHIFRNAMVPIVNGIPVAVTGTIVGATLTETVFAFPGMGKMLIDAIRSANNTMVIGLIFVFTFIAVFSVLLGDILMTIVDPRIRLAQKGGK